MVPRKVVFPLIEFCIQLAEIPILVHALYESTKTFCKDYLIDINSSNIPQLEIIMSQSDITDMREQSARQNEQEGIPLISYSDEYLEPLALCRKITEQVLSYNILLFHGAVVAVNGFAYLFTAKSGTGKTTHTQLWLKNIPNSYIINGDKPYILFKDNGIYVCGTPWQGKENYGRNEILPLKSICFLSRDKNNYIERITFHDAMPMLLSQCHHPTSGEQLIKAIQLIESLKNVGLFHLRCNIQDDSAIISYHAMADLNSLS